ncbi:Glycosyl transferases group 1 [Sphingomonas sp. YR710]|nr:Glycosyl transferases group 1 [Sphingomonas sp. YR710]
MIELVRASGIPSIPPFEPVVAPGIARMWIDLTGAFEARGAFSESVRVELELARSLRVANPWLRFSIYIDTGFAEIPENQLQWLFGAADLREAYQVFFGRVEGRESPLRSIELTVPDSDMFFHPYGSSDLILSAGLQGDRKKEGFSKLKSISPQIYVSFLVYDIMPLVADTALYFSEESRDVVHRYLDWATEHCDFLLYGSEAAQKDVETQLESEETPAISGKPIRLGIDPVEGIVQDGDAERLITLGITRSFMLADVSADASSDYGLLYRVMLMCLARNPDQTPQLVISGDIGLESDLASMVLRDPRVAGHILIVDPSDDDTAVLYRNCRFTIFAGAYPGWAPSVSKSFAFGKFALAADTPNLRETGYDLIDFVELDDVRSWTEKILSYAGDDRLLDDVQAKIAVQWSRPSWTDAGHAVYEALTALANQCLPSAQLVDLIGSNVPWKKPVIWMDLSLTFLNWGGGMQGIVRVELTYAHYLKKIAPDSRFFAYHNGRFFEIPTDYLTWLWDAEELSAAYDFFHDFWNKAESEGTGSRFQIASQDSIDGAVRHLTKIPENTIVLFCGIGFVTPGQMHSEKAITDMVSPARRVMTSQLLYDFTPFLLPHTHVQSTVDGYELFVKHISNEFEHILYGGKTAQRDGIKIQKDRGWRSPPSDYLEFGSELDLADQGAPPTLRQRRKVLADLGITERFVITVGTIQPRKNHEVLYKAYLRMLEDEMLEEPLQLIFVGKNGWLSDDLLAAIANDERVQDKLLVLSPTDEQLRILYHACEFTLLPSFYEGWSLTLPESLGYGKFCLTADVDPLRETGQDLVEYIDPLDTFRWAERMAYYARNPKEVLNRERVIAEQWDARTWLSSTEMMLDKLYDAHRIMVEKQNGEPHAVGADK